MLLRQILKDQPWCSQCSCLKREWWCLRDGMAEVWILLSLHRHSSFRESSGAPNPEGSFISSLVEVSHCVCVCVCVCVCALSCVQLFVASWTVVRQASLSLRVSREEYWSGFLFPYSRGSSPLKDQTRVSCIYWQVHSLPLVPPRKP